MVEIDQIEKNAENSEKPQQEVRKSSVDGWRTQKSEKSDVEKALEEVEREKAFEEKINERASLKSNYDALKSKFEGSPSMDALFRIHDERFKADKNAFFQGVSKLEEDLFKIEFHEEKDERVRDAKPSTLAELARYREFFRKQDETKELAQVSSGMKDRSKMTPQEKFNEIYQRASKKMALARKKGVPIEQIA